MGRVFRRVVIEAEIEITDLAQAATYTMDVDFDANGVMTHHSEVEQIEAALRLLLTQTLRVAAPEAGLKWISGGVFLRPREGDWHPMFEVAAMPARDDDGSLPALRET